MWGVWEVWTTWCRSTWRVRKRCMRLLGGTNPQERQTLPAAAAAATAVATAAVAMAAATAVAMAALAMAAATAVAWAEEQGPRAAAGAGAGAGARAWDEEPRTGAGAGARAGSEGRAWTRPAGLLVSSPSSAQPAPVLPFNASPGPRPSPSQPAPVLPFITSPTCTHPAPFTGSPTSTRPALPAPLPAFKLASSPSSNRPSSVPVQGGGLGHLAAGLGQGHAFPGGGLGRPGTALEPGGPPSPGAGHGHGGAPGGAQPASLDASRWDGKDEAAPQSRAVAWAD